jgi:membrane protein insertase Oxa1/YidC/SpoIIIJ
VHGLRYFQADPVSLAGNFFYTIFIFPVEQLVEAAYILAYRIFHSPGPALCVVSITVSLCTLPLYGIAEKLQQQERDIQKKLKPKTDSIKAAFKGDERFMILQTYYRQNHYHPAFALRNTLGMALQIPFFIAAYSFLSRLETLQGAPFLFIPDLGKSDRLPGSFNVLPVLMTAINCASVAVYARGLQRKDALQAYGMALVFLALLYNSPSGLVLYWLLNNVFSLGKNILHKALQAKHPAQKTGGEPAENPLSMQCSIYAAFTLFLLGGLVIPASLIASSVEEFSFIESHASPFPFIVATALRGAGLFLAWPLGLYSLFPRKLRDRLGAGLALLSLFALINTFIFPGNYGFLTTALVFSEPELLHPGLKTVAGAVAVFVTVTVLFAGFRVMTRKWFCWLQIILLVSLSGFAMIKLAAIQREFSALAERRSLESSLSGTPEPVCRFSKNGKNVLVIMLDRAIGGYMPYMLREKPELESAFAGFVWYPNSVSFGAWTLFGAPPLFGGYEYAPLEMQKRSSESLAKKHNESMLVLPRLFSEIGYRVTVSDPPWVNHRSSPDASVFTDYQGVSANRIVGAYSDYWLEQHPGVQSQPVAEGLKNNLVRFSIFKFAPGALRALLYDNGDWLTARGFRRGRSSLPKSTLDNYIALDVLPLITRVDRDGANTFTALVNNITHEPAFLEEPDYTIPAPRKINAEPEKHTRPKHYHVTMAALLLLGKWFDFLRENGVYDNTRIIIASDHGSNLQSNYRNNIRLPNGEYVQTYNPLLMFKDFNRHGGITSDNAFMSNADVPLLSLGDIIANPVNPFTRKPLAAEKENGITLTTSSGRLPGDHKRNTFAIRPNEWLHVHDNIFDSANWTAHREPHPEN